MVERREIKYYCCCILKYCKWCGEQEAFAISRGRGGNR